MIQSHTRPWCALPLEGPSMTVIDDTTPQTRDVAALVQRWLVESETHPVEPAAQRLSEVLKDPNGLAFTVGFVDGVVLIAAAEAVRFYTDALTLPVRERALEKVASEIPGMPRDTPPRHIRAPLLHDSAHLARADSADPPNRAVRGDRAWRHELDRAKH